MNEGVTYYNKLFTNFKGKYEQSMVEIIRSLDNARKKLVVISLELDKLKIVQVIS